MPVEQNPVEYIRQIPSDGHNIWAPSPLLRAQSGQTYLGRVFVEVWDNDSRLVLDNPRLSPATLAGTIRNQQYTNVVDPVITVDKWPATSSSDSSYLGRVIIEVHDSQTLVNITGTDSRIMSKALDILDQVK